MEKLLYTSKEAAQMIGCSEYSLRLSRLNGMLMGVDAPKSIKIGKKSVRYEAEELHSWVEKAKNQ